MMRFITTIILASLVLWGIPNLELFPFQIVIWLMTGIALTEFGKMVLKNFPYARATQLVFGLAFTALMLWHRDLEITLLALCFFTFAGFLIVMRFTEPLNESIHRLGLILLGILYLALPLPFWAWLKEFPGSYEWVFLALFPACLTDTFAYLVGKSIGRHKFAPVLSPNKTWEGYAGALLGGLVGAAIVKIWFLPQIGWTHVFGIGIGLWIISPLGDLMESLVKRSVGVKDASQLIPGHGGILDRLDALIFAAPFVYAYSKYVILSW